MNYEFQPTCQIPPEQLNAIYMAAFGYKADGVLVEVGAHDGWHWSCTWGLAKIGWQATYVEPVRELFEECKRTHATHPNVQVRNCCIGGSCGLTTLGMCEYGASSESQEKRFEVMQWTLDAFLEAMAISPQFDLLVIDVEGGEVGVLAGFTLSKWLPKLVIIERPPVPNCFTEAGYTLVYHDWINDVLQRQT